MISDLPHIQSEIIGGAIAYAIKRVAYGHCIDAEGQAIEL